MTALGKVDAVRMKHVVCGTITGWRPSVLASIEAGRLSAGFCTGCVSFLPLPGFERVDA